MKQFLWVKTILTSYNYLEIQARSIDKLIMKLCVNGLATNTYEYLRYNTMSLTDEMIRQSQRKVNLINTKILVEEMLASIDKDLAKVLILKYIDKFLLSEIADIMNVSIKTIQRRTNRAIEECGVYLFKRGYANTKFREMFADEKWVFDIYLSHGKASCINSSSKYSGRNQKSFS